MTTSILPLRLGTARLGQYVEPGAEAPRRIRVHGECWELVTDPLLDVALVTESGSTEAQAAFAARLANILHLNVAHLFVTEGAVVNELVAERIAVAVARVIELDADRITSGQIDTARLNAAAIAAGVATVIELDASRITSGQIDTARLRAQEVAAAVGTFLAIDAGQIVSGQIATGLLNAAEIGAAIATIIELNADRITTGTLDADRIAAHSITVGKILVDGELAAEIVNAMTVATKQLVVTDEAILNRATIINGLAADVVSAATIYASQLVVAALDADGKLKPDSVGTVQIVDGAVRAAQIHAEEVAGAVARFLTIEVGQLTAGTADIGVLVAQKIAGATADFQEAFIQNLRSNGAEIDEAVIGDLAANIITSGLFRTAETGQRLEIDSNGLVLYGLDPDGVEYEMARLGPSGANLLTIGSTVVSPDSVASSRGAFDDLAVGGDDLAAVLARLPKGRIGQNRYSAVSAFSSEQQIRLTTRVDVEPGRQYRITVTPFDAQGQGAGDIIYRLGWHWGAGTGTWDTVNTLGWGRNAMSTSEQKFPGIVGELHTGAQSGLITFTFFTSTTGSNGVRLVADGTHPIFLTVDDLGPRVDDAGAYWTYGNGGGGDTTPPPPATTRTTTTWASGGVGGDMSAGDVVQGYYSGVGMRSGGWIFPAAMRTALAGSTIEKLEVYLYASHWYYGSGGTASIRPNNGSYTGWVGTAFTSPNWPRNAGRWVTVPASWYSAIAAGTYRGIGVQTTSTSSLYYGRFTGSATKFRATYKK